MGDRRGNRGIHRTDEQILAHAEDIELLRAIAAGRLSTAPELRMSLRRLAREECILAGFRSGTTPLLLPRGQAILAAANGEVAGPLE